MDYFPIFLKLKGQKVLVIGSGEDAVAKLRLLLKTSALIEVFAGSAPVDAAITAWHEAGLVALLRRNMRIEDTQDARLAYIATDDDDVRDAAMGFCEDTGLSYSVVDDLSRSAFITPAIVDRSPVVVAIGSEGTAPVLVRSIKARIEAWLAPEIGILAKVAGSLRSFASILPKGVVRRRFWSRYLEEVAPTIIRSKSSNLESALKKEFEDLLVATHEGDGIVTSKVIQIIQTGYGDADLLTRQALTALHDADLVIYYQEVKEEIIELARRESARMAVADVLLSKQDVLLTKAVQRGESIVYLMSPQAPDLRHSFEDLGIKSTYLASLYGEMSESKVIDYRDMRKALS